MTSCLGIFRWVPLASTARSTHEARNLRLLESSPVHHQAFLSAIYSLQRGRTPCNSSRRRRQVDRPSSALSRRMRPGIDVRLRRHWRLSSSFPYMARIAYAAVVFSLRICQARKCRS
ncbi:hypothetical protein B0H10DRAFT_1366757 [Mycena sp. CBHHK59/15]|nr:hypothetical protein B0H10DRAFT_1366757 [Mycena sp. CBHHK59/15]